MVGLSAELVEQKRALERLLFAKVYRHPVVLEQRARAGDVLRQMFHHYASHPDQLPDRFAVVLAAEGPQRAAADYLASLTDRGAFELSRRLP